MSRLKGWSIILYFCGSLYATHTLRDYCNSKHLNIRLYRYYIIYIIISSTFLHFLLLQSFFLHTLYCTVQVHALHNCTRLTIHFILLSLKENYAYVHNMICKRDNHFWKIAIEYINFYRDILKFNSKNK